MGGGGGGQGGATSYKPRIDMLFLLVTLMTVNVKPIREASVLILYFKYTAHGVIASSIIISRHFPIVSSMILIQAIDSYIWTFRNFYGARSKDWSGY